MAGFIYKLQQIVNTSPFNDDADVAIARCLLKNINQVNKKTNLQNFADLCYTSSASISRFAQRTGYLTFNDFKADCLGVKEELNEMIIDSHALQTLEFKDFSNQISKGLFSIEDNQLNEYIDKLCDMIHKASRVFIFATHIPGDIACMLQRALLTTGKYVEFFPRKEHQMEIVKEIRSNDLCIFISLEGTLLMEKGITVPAIVSLAKNVLITQNIHVKFSESFSLVVGLGEHNTEIIGKYKLLFFVDCLTNRYYQKYIVTDLK